LTQELTSARRPSPGAYASAGDPAIRTTNLLERLFGEERRRTKVIPHAFGERTVLKLMYAALIRAAERWRGLCMTEFERRQLIPIRNELDRAHAERTAPS
jgi:putative transposase